MPTGAEATFADMKVQQLAEQREQEYREACQLDELLAKERNFVET